MAIADRRKREREQRRNEIINAAEKLFFAKDYDNVTMDEIANEAEVNKALLYYYFKNKESLFFAVVLRAAKIINKMFKESVKSQENGMNKLRDMGWAYFNFYRDFPDYYKIYISFEYQRFKNSDDKYFLEITQLNYELMETMRKAIEEGIKDGSIRKDVNPLEISMFIATTSQSIVKINPEHLKAMGISIEQYFEYSMDLYRQMLMNTENKD